MSKVTANMPLTETSKLMDSLEKNFEDLEVKTKVMDDAMQNATTVQQPVDQVANLMQEMADEAGIELNLNIPSAPAINTSVAMKEQVRLPFSDSSNSIFSFRTNSRNVWPNYGKHKYELITNSHSNDFRRCDEIKLTRFTLCSFPYSY